MTLQFLQLRNGNGAFGIDAGRLLERRRGRVDSDEPNAGGNLHAVRPVEGAVAAQAMTNRSAYALAMSLDKFTCGDVSPIRDRLDPDRKLEADGRAGVGRRNRPPSQEADGA